MKNLVELRSLTTEELQSELLSLRKSQLGLRIKKANGSLDKMNLIPQVRKAIAQVKTIMTEKARNSDGR